MKSASEFDVQCAVNGWYGNLSNVMFSVTHPWHGWLLAHIKDHVEINHHYMLAMETHDGCPIIVEYEWLRAVQRNEGTPAKAKRKPQKGTKPWLAKFEYVDYDPNLMSPGVKVMCRDKKVRVVVGIEYFNDGEHVIVFSGGYTVFLHSGKAYYGDRPWCSDIMKILVEKKIEKTVNDKYCGYAPDVWHFWQGKSSTPVDGDVEVQCWLRKHKQESIEIVKAQRLCWVWSDRYPNGDIIAFRIAE